MNIMQPDASAVSLPGYSRCLCLLTMVLLVGSTCVEVTLSLSFWWQGAALPAIFSGWQQSVVELRAFAVPDCPLVWAGTLLLDMLSLLPWYVALLGIAGLFWQFYCGRIWVSKNIVLLKAIGLLLLFDGVFPLLRDPLQLLLFTWHHRPVLQIGLGLSSDMVRTFIVGFSLYVLSVVIDKARLMNDEIRLII